MAALVVEVEVDNETGKIRLIHPRKTGDWASYHGVASMVIDGETYYAVTPYFEGTFPVHRPFIIRCGCGTQMPEGYCAGGHDGRP